jgi:hypothetical protein
LLDPADALAAAAPAGLSFVESRPLGGTWLLDGLWRRLGPAGTAVTEDLRSMANDVRNAAGTAGVAEDI